MFDYDIYKDIAKRTNGDIYVGVVGPVRTGKSTFISRFMQELVLPNVSGSKKTVAVDELPQSASGKTIMTTEPKFVPAEAVTVNFGKAKAKVRLIDCVGYLVDGAIGHEEEEKPRYVKTPWDNQPLPFEKAAELGTAKVIGEHSTVGIVITTDGSFTEISRASYLKAEERVISELKSLNKPFIIIYNTVDPNSKNAQKIRREMEEKYGVTVVCDNINEMDNTRLTEAFGQLLLEFPMRSFDIKLPEWMQALPINSNLINNVIENVKKCASEIHSMKSFSKLEKVFSNSDTFNDPEELSLDMGKGTAALRVNAKSGVFYKVLSDECGEEISDELQLLKYVKELAEAKRSYSKLKGALECAETTGYGVVTPQFADADLTQPEVVKKAGGYCVKMRAKAKSLHIIRADVETDVSPISGTKKQCEDFVDYFSSSEESTAWDTAVFGRPLRTIVSDEISQSSSNLGDNVKYKLRKTVTKAVNEKKTNLFCLLI